MTDWNQFRGDRRNSSLRLDLEGPDRLEEQWAVELAGPVSCSPVIGRTAVYIGTERGQLYAFDRDGRTDEARRRWVFETTAGTAVAGTPVVTRDSLFLQTTDGSVFALEPSTGDQCWEYSATGPLESSLALSEDTETLFIGEASGLTALEADTGQARWTHETEEPVVGCPAVATRQPGDRDWDHDRVYAATQGETVLALETGEGTEVWSVPTDGTVVDGPTVDGDRVYTADDAGTMLALDVDTGQSWFAYQTKTTFTTGSTVLSDADAAFVGAADEYLHVVETTFGKRKLRGLLFSKNGVSLDGAVATGPVVVGDILCVGDSSGTLYGIGVDDDRFGEFVWHYPTDREPSYTPAVETGLLYTVFDGDRLTCLTWDRDD